MEHIYHHAFNTWSNPVLKAGGKTLTNKSWQQRGINQVGQIVKNGYMVPFNVLKTQYDLKDVDFFAYLQLKSILGLLPYIDHCVARRHRISIERHKLIVFFFFSFLRDLEI